MKRILRKVASIFIATAMVAAMGVSAFAAPIGDDGIKEGTNLGDPVGNSITLYKGLTAYNTDGEDIQAPNITYSYSIVAGAADKRITDDQGVSVLTKAGVGIDNDKVSITSSVAWADTEILAAASSSGTEYTKPITVTFANDTFSAAGVYRYVITETVNPGTPAAAGVTRADNYITTRYLDVYVKDGTTAGSYVVYGYVCFATQLDHLDDYTDKNVAQAIKTKGFVTSSVGTTSYPGDAYYTYNVTVGKSLVNDNANLTHEFPFTVTFKNSTVTQKINLISQNTGNVTLSEIATSTITNLKSEPTIADSGYVKYIGIPCGTTVEVYETNDITTSAYMSKCDTVSSPDTAADEKLINNGVASNTASVSCGANATGASKTVTFTNTLELISPTGVAMAILPFVILLGFGIGFMVLGTTKRKEEYEI